MAQRFYYIDGNRIGIVEVPEQFHEALAYKAIAMGYKDPRNLDINLAQYFDMEYEKCLKMGKRYAKSQRRRGGFIVPHEY